MKSFNLFTPTHLFVLLAGCLGMATAAPYPPDGRETSWVQPGGETLKLRLFGDEYYARTESADGYTLIFDSRTKTYYYASLSADGTEFNSTGILATEPAPAGLVKHLALSKAKIREISLANNGKLNAERQKRWGQRVEAARQLRTGGNGANGANGAALKATPKSVNPAPVVGNKRGLTILVEFPDDSQTSAGDAVNFPTNREKIVRFCNTVGYVEDGNTGSVRDYFSDQSLGKLTYTQTVTPIVTLPRPRNFYNYSDYPANKVLFEDIGATANRLIRDAVTELKKQNFDFSSLSVDNFGRAIATNVFFAGEDSGVFAQGLWPHQSSLGPAISVGTANNPIFLLNYQITNIPDAAPVIGTFCHENGHLLLDLPDIYSQFGEGVGEHCLMGSGNYLNNGRTPPPINAYFKDVVAWATVTDFAITDFKTVRLPTTGNIAYRLTNPAIATEYFMVENRGDGDKWAEFTRDKGIVIWHIDETVNGNFNIAAGDNYGVAIEQADGQFDLEQGDNRGDGGDLFDLNSPKFNDNTLPNAAWWDGKISGVQVEVLGETGARTDVLFGAVPPNTILVDSPNGGEVIFPGSQFRIGWRANLTGNVRIELFKAGVFHSLLSAIEPNDGKFLWPVAASLQGGRDYSIRISSLTNPVPTSDLSDASFTVSEATFPADGIMPYRWFKPGSAKAGWSVTKSEAYEGTHSLISRKIGDGKTSGIAYRANFKAGNVSFYMRVSSEQGFDFGRFYINGVVQRFADSNGRTGLTGQSGWVFASFPVPEGTHTFMWTFEKDDSYEGLNDSAWVDGVSLPESTQEIAVANPAGADVADGVSTSSFPDATVGSSTKPLTFTINNRGKAPLTGLKISAIGVNPQDFVVRNLKKSNLNPKTSTTFEVVFSPKAAGFRTASLRISSNDEDESDFGITLEGNGFGLPKIAVFAADGTKFKDDGKVTKFGYAVVGTTGMSRTFTIKNQGEGSLRNLAVSKSGSDRSDFKISPLTATSLAPGESTTFEVTFKPSARDERIARIEIRSNDEKSGPFDLNISGIGAPKSGSNPASANPLVAAFGSSSNGIFGQIPQATSVEVIQGQKYLALTVTKQAGDPVAGSVEVSPNLLYWFSGTRHTTILIDDATTLKVRDNTPISGGVKRYIRLK